jgi:hypothetical protein
MGRTLAYYLESPQPRGVQGFLLRVSGSRGTGKLAPSQRLARLLVTATCGAGR